MYTATCFDSRFNLNFTTIPIEAFDRSIEISYLRERKLYSGNSFHSTEYERVHILHLARVTKLYPLIVFC